MDASKEKQELLTVCSNFRCYRGTWCSGKALSGVSRLDSLHNSIIPNIFCGFLQPFQLYEGMEPWTIPRSLPFKSLPTYYTGLKVGTGWNGLRRGSNKELLWKRYWNFRYLKSRNFLYRL